jgi:uncharacterized protein
MSNSYGLKQGDLEQIIAVLHKEHAIETAIVFGSRVKGNYKNGSDVDIALKGNELTDAIAAHISFELNEETPMPYKFDILNYATIGNLDLRDHINRIGVIIYEKVK